MKPKKNKKWIVLLVIALFIPLIVVGLILKQNLEDNLDTGKIVRVELSEDGKELSIEDQDKIRFLIEIVENGAQIDEAVNSLDEYTKCGITFRKLNSAFSYTLYLSDSANNCLFTDSDGKLYRIPSEKATGLLEIDEFKSLVISYASAPVAQLSAGEKRYGASSVKGEWSYTNSAGVTDHQEVDKTFEDQAVIPQGAVPALNFAVAPDFCSIKILNAAGEILYDGAADGLSAFSCGADAYLDMTVSCDWYEAQDKDYSGSLEYVFRVFYDVPATFSVDKSSALPGDFFVVRVINSSCENIAVTTSFAGGTVQFFTSGNDRIALVPVGIEVKPSDYTITLMGSDIEGEAAVGVAMLSPAAMNTASGSLGAAYSEMDALLRSLSSDSTRLWDSASGFRLPAGTMEAVQAGFGALLSNGSETIRHMGYDISIPAGTEVGASAAGKCVYAGTTQLLGNTVILDHGNGILSVYGNLGSIALSTGVVVQAGQSVGSSAGGGLCVGESVHFETVVGGIPVNPALLLTAPLPF